MPGIDPLFQHSFKYLLLAAVAFGVTYLVTPVVRGWATRVGMVDQPGQRRLHRRPTPRGGGIAVVLGVQAACVLGWWLPLTRDYFNGSWWVGFSLASAVIVILGLIDDWRGIRPWTKLAGQIVASSVLWWYGARFGSLLGFNLPIGLDYAITVFWLVAITNAFNLIDGMDGLASGLAIISALGLVGVSLFRRMPADALPLLALIGACLAFLRYNFHPASIFLGDTGSMFLGFSLGAVALNSNVKGALMVSLAVPVLAAGVPALDTFLAMWRRSARMLFPRPDNGATEHGNGSGGNGNGSGNGNGKSNGNGPGRGLMEADTDHLHHRLLRSGLTPGRVALWLYAANAAVIAVVLVSMLFKSHGAAIYMMAFVAGIYVLVRHVAHVELWDTGQALLRGLKRPSRKVMVVLFYPMWDAACLCLGMAAVVMLAGAGEYPSRWEAWIRQLPFWLGPTFILLCMVKTYSRVWSRARMSDYLVLSLALVGGTVGTVGLLDFFEPDEWVLHWSQAAVFASVVNLLILGSRSCYRMLQELNEWLGRKQMTLVTPERVLLLGAGGRCQIYLREQLYRGMPELTQRHVIGLIDDDPNLRRRWVAGYQVLGNRIELPKLIQAHQISRVVITADVNQATRAAVHAITHQSAISLSEWVQAEIEVGDSMGERNGAMVKRYDGETVIR
jgi:UDP-GlcNAc:undecaprenyl-phosphate/decaprenyl-phosphate GlcNAc-1-phosphate transferase